MENTTTYTMEDGTEYRLTYDNETDGGQQMHYLLHENGVLKLECRHHALPVDLTEEEFRSSVVPLAFLNCLGRTMNDIMVKREAELSGDTFTKELAKLIRPHVALEPDQVEYVSLIAERGHSVELFVQLQHDLEVERFARQLNTPLITEEEVQSAVAEGAARASVRAFLATYWPAIVWAVGVVLVSGGAILLSR